MTRLIRSLAVFLLLSSFAFAQSRDARNKFEKAMRELDRRNVPKAEQLFREAANLAPEWIEAHVQLGDVLFLQKKYDAAAETYAKAAALEEKQKKLAAEDRRRMLDQLGVSQAMGRHLDQAIATYKKAIEQDPEYPLFHYNLACSYAEKGDLDNALPHLKKSWELRDNMPRGQDFPDPRKDSSFKKFWNNPKFQEAVENMVV